MVWYPPPGLGATYWPWMAPNGPSAPPKPSGPPPPNNGPSRNGNRCGMGTWAEGDGEGVAAVAAPGAAGCAGDPVAANATPAPASRPAVMTPARTATRREPSQAIRRPLPDDEGPAGGVSNLRASRHGALLPRAARRSQR